MISNASLRRLGCIAAIACTLLASCRSSSTVRLAGTDFTKLAPCTGDNSIFSQEPFADWPTDYHTEVDRVIDAHMRSLKQTSTLPLECTAPDYASMVKPTPELQELAAQLSPWKDPAKMESLSETEIGPVLLEWLRVYECALNERNEFKAILVPQERNGGDTFSNLQEENKEGGIIQHEIALARPALEKTLMIVGGEDRLRPLSLDIECLKRTSLDIRNVLGLVSQASACLPRVRDARGSLRDLPDLTQP